MKILGISAFYHDFAAALVVDEKIVTAAQEERFTRKNMTRTSRSEQLSEKNNSPKKAAENSFSLLAFTDGPELCCRHPVGS